MKKNIFAQTAERLRSDPVTCVILALFFLFCMASGIYFAVSAQSRNALLSFAYILLAPAALAAEYLIGFRFPALFNLLLYFLIAGGILGSCYDVYYTIPCFDEILHGISGLLFAAAGFTLMKRILGGDDSKKNFFLCLLVGALLSLTIANLWEMFEYASYAFFGIDMQEDMIVNGFSSYLLSGTHNETVVVDGIVKTVIYLSDGSTRVIDGGYLDIGMYDTLNDMLVCLVGCAVFTLLILLDYKFGGKCRHALIGKIPCEYQKADSPACDVSEKNDGKTE